MPLIPMTALDAVAIVLVLAGALMGALRGAIRILVTALAVVAGLLMAGRYGGSLGADQWPGLSGMQGAELLGPLVGCLMLFVATLIAGAVAGRLLRRLVAQTDLGRVDRLLGASIGMVVGALLSLTACIVVLAANPPSWREGARPAVTASITQVLIGAVRERLPEGTSAWLGRVLNLPPDRRR